MKAEYVFGVAPYFPEKFIATPRMFTSQSEESIPIGAKRPIKQMPGT